MLRQRLMFGLGATGSASAASSASRPASTGRASGTPVLGLEAALAFTSVLVLACWPASLAAAEKSLRWKFTAGQQLVVELRQTTVTEARWRDEPQRMTTKMALEML